VASGATLKAQGNVAPIGKLTVDGTAGAGTIDGLAFASTGTLDIKNAPSKVFDVPVNFVNAPTKGNLEAWGVTADGKDVSHKSTVRVTSTGLHVQLGRGLIIMFR